MTFPNPLLMPDLVEGTGLKLISDELSPQVLEDAYSAGYFPWGNEDEPMLWYAPEPRFVLYPEDLRLSKSNRKLLRDEPFTFALNQDFEQILMYCANIPRFGQEGTWLYPELQSCIKDLHAKGLALSVSAYKNGKLVGGLYGIIAGKNKQIFCGESMFSLSSNASKLAFVWFVQNVASKQFKLIDCQQESEHLKSFGAKNIEAKDYLELLSD